MTTPTQLRITAGHTTWPGLELLAPRGSAWDRLPETRLRLSPTPLDAQPSAYVRVSRAERPYGTLPAVDVAAAVTDGALYLRLRWQEALPHPAITDNDVFADACAIMFPRDGIDADLQTMGSPERPVEAWHWRAGTELPFVLNATGLGTATRLAHHALTAAAEWQSGQWSVVFRRVLDGPGVPLKPATIVPAAFAVWQGWNAERAGLASCTLEWAALEIAT